MTAPRRTPSSDRQTRRAPIREDVFVPIGNAVPAGRPLGVAELLRRLSEAESKLKESEQDRATDAELIGSLLAEIADRDRRLKSLESSNERRPESAASDIVSELLGRLTQAHGGDTDLSELHDLLAVTFGALDLTRTTATENARKLEETSAAMANAGQRGVERDLAATLGRTTEVVARTQPIDRSIGRIVERLREIEKRERELGELRNELLEHASELIVDVRVLRDTVGTLATTGEPPRRKPSKLPTRRP